jgi:DNA-binding transcriptional MerR regulator
MPIREVRRFAELRRRRHATVAERRRLLEAHRERVERSIAELKRSLVAIDVKLARMEGLPTGEET